MSVEAGALRFEVGPERAGERLDRFLSRSAPGGETSGPSAATICAMSGREPG